MYAIRSYYAAGLGFNTLDYVLLGVLFLSCLIGYIKGIIITLFNVIGYVAGVVLAKILRITSYNVCYTKLLRQMWQDFQQTGISVKRLGDIFNVKPEPSMDNSKLALPPIKGRVTFENVSFRYRPDGAKVISDLSFNIESGTIVGIVGRSGSGKSTISKLAQRLYVPENGKILIDGIDISLADPAWLRRQIGVVLHRITSYNVCYTKLLRIQ